MRRGERVVLGLIGVVVVGLMVQRYLALDSQDADQNELPFFSTASAELARTGMDLYRRHQCKRCHSLWTVRDVMQNVPAPALDGIGALRDEGWLFAYLSAPDPQAILPSRLKPEYRMPSYAGLPAEERRLLAGYLASLQVKDWYLDETRKAECRKLTGEAC